MDEPRNEINRDQLLKLGGIGALGAVAALLADTAPADASTPIGLDYQGDPPGFYTAAALTAASGTASRIVAPEPVWRVLITRVDPNTASVKPDHIFKLTNAHVHAVFGDHEEDEDRPYVLWVAIWTKKPK